MTATAPPRPTPLPVNVAGIPDELKARDQWVVWRYELRGGTWTKPPLQCNLGYAKSNDDSTWIGFDAVVDRYLRGGVDGIGYMFAVKGEHTNKKKGKVSFVRVSDPYVGIDIDKCRDAETGAIED